jgi:glycosyltransferase involved in cell wall biosynthesis
MTRIVFVTQAADPSDPVLGATLAKIRALAARVDELVVLARRVDRGALPANCVAHSFSAPTQALRGARYGALLAAELVRRPLAVVVHMSPVYALLAAPLARPFRVPILLWFTQQAGGERLGRAERVVASILTVDERSVPLVSAKVVPIGHGIDVAALPCVPPVAPPLRRLLGLGRYAPVKGWDTVVRALPELPGATLAIHGPTLTDRDRVCLSELEQLADSLGIADRVSFGKAVSYMQVSSLFSEFDALVNATIGNAADKVVYEAAASCLPVFAASPVFDKLLPSELRFPAGDSGALAERIRAYARVDGNVLRKRVSEENSVDGWAERVLAAAQAATRR